MSGSRSYRNVCEGLLLLSSILRLLPPEHAIINIGVGNTSSAISAVSKVSYCPYGQEAVSMVGPVNRASALRV